MSGQNTKSLSVSFRMDDGIIEHNNRDFIAKNVDTERVSDNITYVCRDVHEIYDELFGKALTEYNAKQKRNDRKIADYYAHIENDGRLKPFYEVVVQFGNVESCGLTSGKWETAKLMLDSYMRDFEKRNPNLKVFNAVMHLDEATPHLHIDFIPVAYKEQRSLSVKVSMKGALREQGFYSSNRFNTEWTAWAERERGVMIDILHDHDLSLDVKNVHCEHLTVDEYKTHAAQIAEIRKTNEHINELKKKNPAELTPDEIELIKNQNDIMRSEIQKRDEKISSLSRKLGAKFVPLEIFSEDKLQYVAAELEKANVPFVEENNALHIPVYAQKTAAAIAAGYKPTADRNGVRDRIRLDIDRLVYCSENLSDLFDKLKERGYQIKNGREQDVRAVCPTAAQGRAATEANRKHIAVKPTFAERFVRLRSLGEAYLPKNLEQRIADRDKFPTAVRARFETANAVEKKFHIAITDVVIAVKQFKIMPRKLDPKKIYAFQNDAHINYLSEQLCTIGEFNLGSREQIYTKAEELKNGIDGKTAKLKELSDEIPTLKSDIAQLRRLFSVGDNPKRLDTMEQVKQAAAREIADKHNVKSAEDIADLEKHLKSLQSEEKSVKAELSNEQLKLKRIYDLIMAYEKIVEGDYINNLFRAQKEQAKALDKRT